MYVCGELGQMDGQRAFYSVYKSAVPPPLTYFRKTRRIIVLQTNLRSMLSCRVGGVALLPWFLPGGSGVAGCQALSVPLAFSRASWGGWRGGPEADPSEQRCHSRVWDVNGVRFPQYFNNMCV